MSAPQIHGRWRTVSASSMLGAIGDSLREIKAEDQLTDVDLGAELGKSEDQAAKYRTGLADMPATVFIRACARWDGRFANKALALVGMKLTPLDAGEASDRSSASALTKLLLEMSVALEDGTIDDAELGAMRATLEQAGRAIDGMRERLSVRSAA